MAERRSPDDFLTEDEKERKRFRKWLARQKKDKDTQVREEVQEDFTSLERAKEKWLMAVANVHYWKLEAKRLAVYAIEAREKAQIEEESLTTWTTTFHARLQDGIDLSRQKVTDLLRKYQETSLLPHNTQEEQDARKIQMDEVASEIKGVQSRMERLQKLKDYKPIRRVLDMTLADIPVTQLPESPSEEEHAKEDSMKLYYEQRYCSVCGRVKIASFHPLCLSCQKKAATGGLDGPWTGVQVHPGGPGGHDGSTIPEAPSSPPG